VAGYLKRVQEIFYMMQFPLSHTSGLFPRRSAQYYTRERLKKRTLPTMRKFHRYIEILCPHEDRFIIRKIKCHP